MKHQLWRSSWQPGPVAHELSSCTGLLVSVTEFTGHSSAATVSSVLSGFRLRRSWPGTPGAIGLWLWMDATVRWPRTGSVALWQDRRSLGEFVARPDHRRIVRSHRHRGVVRSAVWRTDEVHRSATWHAAVRVLTGDVAWPEPGGPAAPAERGGPELGPRPWTG